MVVATQIPMRQAIKALLTIKLAPPLSLINALTNKLKAKIIKPATIVNGSCDGVPVASASSCIICAPGKVDVVSVVKLPVIGGTLVIKGEAPDKELAGALASDTGWKVDGVALTSASLEVVRKVGVASWRYPEASVKVVPYSHEISCTNVVPCHTL